MRTRTRRASRLALIVLAALPAAPAGGAVSCRSGFSVHESEGVRLFVADTPRKEAGLWGCTTRVRKPALIWESSPATTLAGGAEGLFGRRLAFDLEEYADGGNGRWLGWFDVRTGRSAFAEVGGPRKRVEPEEDDSFTPAALALAVGGDGSIGYAFESFGKNVELFAKPYAGAKFGREVAVATLPDADFDPSTLVKTVGELRWRTRGAVASAPLPAPPAVSKAPRGPLPRGVTCRAGEGLYLGSRARVFRTARGLFACSENEKARPVTIGGRRARLLRATETASAFAYVVREGSRETVGYMDVRSSALRARVRRATDYGGVPEILGLATRTDGGVAFAAEAGVFLMPPAGRSLGAPVQLATGSVAPHTLSLTKTAVEWRAVGEPRSESLPGT